jgi:hypothetical protein
MTRRRRRGRDADLLGLDPASFDHAKTDFPLEGAHVQVPCALRHPGARQGEQCASCHGETSWLETARFDHDLTRFPLLGLHAVAPCEACHASRTFADADTRCATCHGDDDHHGGRLGSACESCHNPNAWRATGFDHSARTGFALTGAHADLACERCHRASAGAGGPMPRIRDDCGGCHRADDPHGDAFGSDCGRCHGDRDWRDVRIER